jgi:hypothetical protein
MGRKDGSVVYICYWASPGARGGIVVKCNSTSRMVAGSRPDEMNVINLPHPSGRTGPWGLLSLPKMSTRSINTYNVSGEWGRRVRLATLPPSESPLSG